MSSLLSPGRPPNDPPTPLRVSLRGDRRRLAAEAPRSITVPSHTFKSLLTPGKSNAARHAPGGGRLTGTTRTGEPVRSCVGRVGFHPCQPTTSPTGQPVVKSSAVQRETTTRFASGRPSSSRRSRKPTHSSRGTDELRTLRPVRPRLRAHTDPHRPSLPSLRRSRPRTHWPMTGPSRTAWELLTAYQCTDCGADAIEWLDTAEARLQMCSSCLAVPTIATAEQLDELEATRPTTARAEAAPSHGGPEARTPEVSDRRGTRGGSGRGGGAERGGAVRTLLYAKSRVQTPTDSRLSDSTGNGVSHD